MRCEAQLAAQLLYDDLLTQLTILDWPSFWFVICRPNQQVCACRITSLKVLWL